MSAKVLTEYPKTISKECMNEITERNKGRDTCLEFGNELAKKHDMQDCEEKVKIEQKKWIDEDRFYRSADNLIQEIEQNDIKLNQSNTKIGRSRELEEKLKSLIEGRKEKNSLNRALNNIKRAIHAKKNDRDFDVNKIITAELQNVGLDIKLCGVLYGDNAESIKELKFKPDTENKDHLKVDGEKFTILFYENTQSVEISTTHSGVDELFRYLKNYKFPIGIRSVNLAIIPKIDKPEKIDHKKPIKDVESDEDEKRQR